MTLGVLAAVAASSSASNDVEPGLLGFLVVAALGVALVFLLRSMNRHLRKITPPPGADDDQHTTGQDITGQDITGQDITGQDITGRDVSAAAKTPELRGRRDSRRVAAKGRGALLAC